MKTKNNTGGWTTGEAANLSKKDLKEGRVYSIPFLSKDGVVKVNECLYAVINGVISIHRSANWEDISRDDLRAEAFLAQDSASEIPDDLACFIDLEQTVK